MRYFLSQLTPGLKGSMLMDEPEIHISTLVVDDDDTLRRALEAGFMRRGFSVRSANTVRTALEIFREFKPLWVVLDLRMPGCFGLEFIKEVKSCAEYDFKIVVITGYGSISTAVSAMQLGAYSYLTKPVDMDCLINTFEGKLSAQEGQNTKLLSLQDMEWEHIQKTLADCQGNISKAAKALGMHRRSLQRKLNGR